MDADAETAEERSRLNAGDPLPVIDGLLAASAGVRGWTLVRRDTAGLARSGVTRLSPLVPWPVPDAGQHG